MLKYPTMQNPDEAWIKPDAAVIKPDVAVVKPELEWMRVGPAELSITAWLGRIHHAHQPRCKQHPVEVGTDDPIESTDEIR